MELVVKLYKYGLLGALSTELVLIVKARVAELTPYSSPSHAVERQ